MSRAEGLRRRSEERPVGSRPSAASADAAARAGSTAALLRAAAAFLQPACVRRVPLRDASEVGRGAMSGVLLPPKPSSLQTLGNGCR